MTIKSGTGFSSKDSMSAAIKTVKTVKTIKFGPLEFEGLLLEDGSFAVAVSQLLALGLVPDCYSLNGPETQLGAFHPFSFKVKTELQPTAVDCVSLMVFERILRVFEDRGLEVAVDLVDDLYGLALEQMFLDAFGVRWNPRRSGG